MIIILYPSFSQLPNVVSHRVRVEDTVLEYGNQCLFFGCFLLMEHIEHQSAVCARYFLEDFLHETIKIGKSFSLKH